MSVDGSNRIAVLLLGGNVTKNVSLVFCLIGVKVKPEIVLCPYPEHGQFILLIKFHLVLELKISIGWQERQPYNTKEELEV